MPETLTFRERIMQSLDHRFRQQSFAIGSLIEWDAVTRKPITTGERNRGNVLGVYDTSERVTKEINWDVRFLNVVLEFSRHIHEAEADDIPTILNQTLGEVQRVAGLDIQISDKDNPAYKLALNTREKGNEIDIVGEKPSVVQGVVILEVQYRTRNNDPFRR